MNGSEIEGMLLTQEDIIHDLGQLPRVLERLQRKVKLALNRSIVDVSHHCCDAVVPPPIVLADGQLRLNPCPNPSPGNHSPYVRPMRERRDVSSSFNYSVPVRFRFRAWGIRTPAILEKHHLSGIRIHRHKTASATASGDFWAHRRTTNDIRRLPPRGVDDLDLLS